MTVVVNANTIQLNAPFLRHSGHELANRTHGDVSDGGKSFEPHALRLLEPYDGGAARTGRDGRGHAVDQSKRRFPRV